MKVEEVSIWFDKRTYYVEEEFDVEEDLEVKNFITSDGETKGSYIRRDDWAYNREH